MTNILVGEVYKKIIEDVIRDSKTEFEENGISQTTLVDLEKEWKTRISAREVAHMTWDPKPAPPIPVQQQQPPNPAPPLPSTATNGLPPSYAPYNQSVVSSGIPTGIPNGVTRIKAEPAPEPQYHGLPNGYPQSVSAAQGGEARAAQLAQQYREARGLALPGQRPQGMQHPGQAQQQHQQAQQMYLQQRQQQAALQQQQAQPRIKVENDSPQLHQGTFQQQPRPPNPAYARTDGADEGLEEWQAYMANRRAVTAEQTQRADHMMRDHVMQGAADLQSGLMMTLEELPKGGKKRRARVVVESHSNGQESSTVPQLDGEFDDDEKPIKDEDDADAINSDLDSDEDPTGDLDEDEDEFADSILCTYDKVQRVKNKWKCILKDGVMSINKKEWVFHKGTGEFEW
ncbi:transcription factor IIA subunit alpha [Teratosphaeriaceae sp. CCFEE 6253]|nr:transcription factor IIA subunit alpha [Teratosphaeriaceae sp. CCFEE 6253]